MPAANQPYTRVLFVAPTDSGLDVAPESTSLYEYGYQVQVVPSPVTRQRLFDVIRRASFDVLHFATHANRDGVVLSAGEVLDVAGLVQLARSSGVSLVFLNACDTAEIGQVLVDEEVPAALVTLRSVPDVTAKETAQVFYKELAKRGDIREAYSNSKPPIKGGYILLSNGKLQELKFGPVLKRIDELFVKLGENSAEHDVFRATFTTIAQQMEALSATLLTAGKLKQWFTVVLACFTALIVLVQLAVILIARAQ